MEQALTVSAHGESWQITDPGGTIGEHLRTGRPYENKLLDHIYRRGFTGAAIDVGAHVGNHSLYLAKVCGLHVYAFEPRPDLYAALVSNIATNNLERQILAARRAAGAMGGTAHYTKTDGMTLDPDGGEVEVVAIDDIASLRVEDVSVVKIDVEGMEPDVIFGMRWILEVNRPTVFAEAHDRKAVKGQQFLMERLGYHLAGETRTGSRMLRWEPK